MDKSTIICERIFTIQKTLKLEDKDMVKAMEINKSSYTQYKAGSIPVVGTLATLCKNLNINTDWLLLGKGSMLK